MTEGVIVGAFLGGGNQTVPAGKCLRHLKINTIDRQNLSTATFTVSAPGETTVTVAADASGEADIIVASGKTYTVVLNHDGSYHNDEPQTFIATSTGVGWTYFDLYQYPDMRTVVRVKTTFVGEEVTATSGSSVITTTTGSDYIAAFEGLEVGSTWTFACDEGSETVTIDHILIDVDLSIPPITINEVSFGMSFNSSTFATNPEGCLVYTGDCAGFTPVSTPTATLGACGTLGSWDMNADGSSSNKLLASCFYATFDSDGNLHELLNPKNLAEKIGEWNSTVKGWKRVSGSSSITTENTMFCFPALYRKGTSSSVTIGTTSESGTAYGATIDGHTYQYEAIGVYEGYVNGSKLMSLSGKASSASITRPNFRTYAAANAVKNGKAMLWNFHQWRDWWHLYLFGAKSFNGQVAIGQGGLTYNSSTGQGKCDAMGLWAGSSTASASESTSVKALIENPWGYKYEFIDDFINVNGTLYAGQNSTPDDTTSNKTAQSGFGTGGGWQSGCMTAGGFWGIRTGTSGSSTTYQCDYAWSGTGTYLGNVGGNSGDVSGGLAGPSCLLAYNSLSISVSNFGARLAFVFDL